MDKFDEIDEGELTTIVGGGWFEQSIGYALGYAIPDYSKMMKQQRAYTRSSVINN